MREEIEVKEWFEGTKKYLLEICETIKKQKTPEGRELFINHFNLNWQRFEAFADVLDEDVSIMDYKFE